MKVIISLGLADGRPMNNGEYLKAFDPEALDGMGSFVWTKDKQNALHFDDAADAFILWNTVPKCRPTRSDGRPNKPLTAFSVEIVDL
jgi:hypothetical protein